MNKLLLIIIAIGLVSCSQPQLEPGVYSFVVKRTITEDWCYLDDKQVDGWWKTYGVVHEQCISLMSPEPFEGTLIHENRHMDLFTHGLDPHFHGDK